MMALALALAATVLAVAVVMTLSRTTACSTLSTASFLMESLHRRKLNNTPITTLVNQTYAPQTAPEFSITWQFDHGPQTAPVHGYPNIRVDDVLPKEMHKISQVDLDLHWTYGLGDTPAESTDVQTLMPTPKKLRVQVRRNSRSWFGSGCQTRRPNPLVGGNQESPGPWTELPYANLSLTSTLYTGKNEQGQYVLSWVPDTITERFTGDIYPLITDLYNFGGSDYPAKEDYLGSLSFGTEVYSVD
ncbi:unnamed protein product, partial [Penicillium nalgiovense]